MTLGLPLEFNKMELSQAFLDTYLRELSTLQHEFVESGPVMENVMTGAEVDVTRFPVPIWHERDGGRYIGTGSFNVTMDPEEKWINAGTYRVMIHDKQSVGFYISPGKHGRIHREKYQARNEPMPVVIVCGGDPLTFLMSSSEMPYGVCELDIVGGLRGKPLKVVRGKVTGLPFPANAEIVLEGFVEPGKVKLEGPFGEWTGYYGSDVREEPVMDVKAIYHRNDPILFGCPPQQPPGGTGALPRGDALGADPQVPAAGRGARRAGGVGARSGRLAHAARGVDQAALSGTRETGGPRRIAMPRRGVHGQVRHRGR